MSSVKPSLFTREDTLFGVCEGLGEDLGIDANLFRVALALGLFWNPAAMAAIYAGCGILVFVLRWLVPDPQDVAAPEAATARQEPAEWTEFADAA